MQAARLRTSMAFALLFLLLPAVAYAAQAHRDEWAQSRPFGGLVRRDMAEQASQTAAELAALQQSARNLAHHPLLQFAGAEGAASSPPLPDLAGLARMLYATKVLSYEVHTAPQQTTTRVYLVPPEQPLRQTLLAALSNPEQVQPYAEITLYQEKILAEYDALAPALLGLTSGAEEARLGLQYNIRSFIVTKKYQALLAERKKTWNNPEIVQKKLEQLLEEAPSNPLLHLALGEVLVQVDRPAAAMEHVAAALQIFPQVARAHDLKGTILLRQRLISLAAAAFGEAIALSPRTTSYYTHRASALLLLEDFPRMCADFLQACALGDCQGYAWGKDTGKCP